jgi:hypothetical protein
MVGLVSGLVHGGITCMYVLTQGRHSSFPTDTHPSSPPSPHALLCNLGRSPLFLFRERLGKSCREGVIPAGSSDTYVFLLLSACRNLYKGQGGGERQRGRERARRRTCQNGNVNTADMIDSRLVQLNDLYRNQRCTDCHLS